MTKGKPYKSAGKAEPVISIYGKQPGCEPSINTGTRHPTTVIKIASTSRPIHQTQKPVKLLEWLIKTYSNKGDTVMDFTMGSGSTGIAAINTGRKFIGIEKNKKIYRTARARILRHEIDTYKKNKTLNTKTT